jgi:DNA polymerase-3 subunit epsilon
MKEKTLFGVVDVETTGVFPERADRVIEIAVLRVDLKGNVLDEYATLVNPNRDITGAQIHGITARDVKNAPLFGEIAGDILSLLAECIFVAHNVHFDLRFVRSEFARIGCMLPDLPYLCTMELARRADPAIPSRQLGELCRYFGINLSQPHTAYDDARATAMLLRTCFSRLAAYSKFSLSTIGIRGLPARPCDWPTLPVSRGSYPRSQAAQDILSEPSYIGYLVSRLPAMPCSQPEIEPYLVLLDRVLEDRRVSAQEADALYALAQECGLSRAEAMAAHQSYIRDLVQIALEDGVITESESRDLEEVRKLLSVSDADYRTILDEVTAAHHRGKPRKNSYVLQSVDVKNRSICFTGEFRCRISGQIVDRSLAESIAAQRGMVVQSNVTKTLDFLVVGDPDSMSTKAKKAHSYGVRIIAEPVFWRMMGVQTE